LIVDTNMDDMFKGGHFTQFLYFAGSKIRSLHNSVYDLDQFPAKYFARQELNGSDYDIRNKNKVWIDFEETFYRNQTLPRLPFATIFDVKLDDLYTDSRAPFIKRT
jgi:hypothetical protein